MRCSYGDGDDGAEPHLALLISVDAAEWMGRLEVSIVSLRRGRGDVPPNGVLLIMTFAYLPKEDEWKRVEW